MIIRIVIPFAGEEDLLKETILSVVHQGNPNWDLYILDNAWGGEELKKWIDDLNDVRVKYKRNTINIGMTNNFNLAKEMINDHWGVILGADDVLGPNFVEVARDLILQFPEVSFLQVRTRVIDINGKRRISLIDFAKYIISPKVYNKPIRGEKALNRLLIGNWLYFPGIIWNPKFAKNLEFNKDLKYCLDLPFEIELLLGSHSIVISKKIEFNYRRHQLSISNNPLTYIDRLQEERQVYRNLPNYFSDFDKVSYKILGMMRLTNRLQILMNYKKYLHRFGIKSTFLAVLSNK